MAKAFNRVNQYGVRYLLQEDEGGGTHICTVGDEVKFIDVKANIDDIIVAWYKWLNGELIQRAFPFLDANEREFIKTGITPDEWDRLFSEHE